MPVVEPHKELRFTRAAQAVPFWLAAAMCLMAAITLVAVGQYRADNPDLPHPGWALLPLMLAWLAARLALRCTRKAYLILTPLGIEVFPFLRPAESMQIVHWSEIHAVDIDDRQLTLHFNPERSSGIHLSLAPIPRPRRELLRQAVDGRVKNHRQAAVHGPQS